MRNKKAKSQLRHARRRAAQRFDVEMSAEDVQKIVALIQAGDAKHIEKQSNRLSVFRIEFAGQTMYPVYDKVRQTIATFLTQRMILEREMGT